MINNTTPKTILKLVGMVFVAAVGFTLSSCSSPKPTTPPVVTRVNPGEPSEGSNFGAEVVVNSTVVKATVVAVDSEPPQVTLKRADGRLTHCKARPGIKEFGGIKVGDEVTLAIGEERALALGKTALPDSGRNAERIRARVPEGMVALADAIETMAFTATIMAIDQWNSIVTLRLTDGTIKTVHTSVAVNLADFKPGDEVSTRVTEVVVLIVQSGSAK
jgi:hypothetical protein